MALQVVGVVSNARVGILWRPEDAHVYLPIGSRSAYTIFRAPSWSPSAAELKLRNEAARVSLRLVAIGVAIGLGGGLAFARLLAVALIGIKPLDLVAFASTSALMASVAALAIWVPARRAAHVDPMVALRHE